MSFTALRGVFEDEVIYDVMSELQSKVGKGNYFIQDVFYDGTEEGSEKTVEELGRESYDVERHLSPSNPTTFHSVREFDGDVKITASLVDSRGVTVEKKVKVSVEYENEEDIDFGEYFGEFIEEAFNQTKNELDGKWVESDEGDFIEHGEVPKGLDGKQVMTLDEDVFVDMLKDEYKGDRFGTLEDVTSLGVEGLLREVSRGIKSGVIATIENFKAGYEETHKFNLGAGGIYSFLVHLRHYYDVKSGSRVKSIRHNKIIFIKGKSEKEVLDNILREYEKLSKGLMRDDLVGVKTYIKKDRVVVNQESLRNKDTLIGLVTGINRISEENGTSGSVIFNKESERLYNDITRRYAFAYEQKEKVRYEKDEWVQKVVQRFTEAANETELSKVYDRKFNNFKIPLEDGKLIIGTHYALVENTGKNHKIIYNMKRDGKSLKDVQRRIPATKENRNQVKVILDLIDGRKNMTKERIEKELRR